MTKEFFIIVTVIVASLIGVFALTKEKDPAANNQTASAQPTDHTVGKGTENVTLIEYGDLQCPACKAYFPIVNEIKKTYGDKIKFQFRHFPLNQIHPHAFLASRSAEAAGNQGKFFEMHDLMYESQDSWTQSKDVAPTFEAFAVQLGLDIEKYKADLSSAQTAAIINADIKTGNDIGAKSTPTFVINGKKIEENPRSIEDFKKLIDDEIAKN